MRRGFAVAVEEDVRVNGSHDGLREASLVVEGKVVQLFGGEPFPTDAAGGGRLPRLRCGRGVLGVGFEEEFGPAAERFSEGSLPALGELFDLGKQLLGNLNLRLCHAGNTPAPSF